MKTFSIAVAVAVILAFTWIQEISADHDAVSGDWSIPIENITEDGSVGTDYKWIPIESWKTPYETRARRAAGLKCRICCNCCPGMRGCGICCRF